MATFKVEAAEHIVAVSSGLLELEKTPAGGRRPELIEVVFREVHSLKGAARTVNLPTIESVCRSLEDIFSVLKKRDREIPPDFFDLLYKALDLLRDLLASLEAEGKIPDESLVKSLIADLARAAVNLEGAAPQGKIDSSTLSSHVQLSISHQQSSIPTLSFQPPITKPPSLLSRLYGSKRQNSTLSCSRPKDCSRPNSPWEKGSLS